MALHRHCHFILAIDLRLDVRLACDGLQQKFQHAEYFTCDLYTLETANSHPIFTQFPPLSSEFHALPVDSTQ